MKTLLTTLSLVLLTNMNLSMAQTTPSAPAPTAIGTQLSWTHPNTAENGDTRIVDGFILHYGVTVDTIVNQIEFSDPAPLLNPETKRFEYNALAVPALAWKASCFQMTAYYLMPDQSKLESKPSETLCAFIGGAPGAPKDLRITD